MQINPQHIDSISSISSDFKSRSPCKFVVLDNFLVAEIADKLYSKFPALSSLKVKRKSLNENKVEDYHFERWDPSFTEVREMIQGKEFLNWMSKLTGIPELVTPNNSLGSGIHQGGNGSFVDVHIDVNFDPKSEMWRRINLLIYLNKNWKEEYGGNLEIWNPDMSKCEHSISPLFNRAIIFLTDENSPHGYKSINIPEGESRKSFYAYYYTEIGEGFKYSDSRFIPRPNDSIYKSIATQVKEGIKSQAKRLLKKLGIKSLDFQDKNKK
jgi:hypothetical protein